MITQNTWLPIKHRIHKFSLKIPWPEEGKDLFSRKGYRQTTFLSKSQQNVGDRGSASLMGLKEQNILYWVAHAANKAQKAQKALCLYFESKMAT